jgi:hypothetical protein
MYAIVSPGQDEISKDELYQGLLLVHLKLAKFAGAAACYVSRISLDAEKYLLSSFDGH